MLQTLREARGPLLEKYANLAAAICVVHARPLVRHINENQVKAVDPLQIFDFYVKNESRMFFGIQAVPAELLVWVVDTTASIDEMNWALAKYAGDRKVGARFFDIAYDYDNFEKGTPKKVDVAGYNLQNILKCGGICADQAYFAVEVGKSIGVPTAYTVGTSADASHAWVGFLEAQNGKGWWDFDSGRYTEYRGVLGSVEDPQTRSEMPDNYVSVLAEMIGTRAIDRQSAAALVDAAHRLIELDHDGKPLSPAAFPTDPSVNNLRPTARKAGTVDALALAELALRQSVGTPAAWFVVRDLAADNKLTLADKQRWAAVLQRLGAVKYPDFTLSILMPMIQTISDPKQQNAMWNSVFTMFQSRFDLAAAIRMQQAAAWEAQGNTPNAGACYMDVIDRYADAGPFVLCAVQGGATPEGFKERGEHRQAIPAMLGEDGEAARRLFADSCRVELVSGRQALRPEAAGSGRPRGGGGGNRSIRRFEWSVGRGAIAERRRLGWGDRGEDAPAHPGDEGRMYFCASRPPRTRGMYINLFTDEG